MEYYHWGYFSLCPSVEGTKLVLVYDGDRIFLWDGENEVSEAMRGVTNVLVTRQGIVCCLVSAESEAPKLQLFSCCKNVIFDPKSTEEKTCCLDKVAPRTFFSLRQLAELELDVVPCYVEEQLSPGGTFYGMALEQKEDELLLYLAVENELLNVYRYRSEIVLVETFDLQMITGFKYVNIFSGPTEGVYAEIPKKYPGENPGKW